MTFPGDSDCSGGLVTNDGAAHVCLKCHGDGCKPKRTRRAPRRALYESLSGSTVYTDQKGRPVFVNLETGTAYVVEI
jgi:hypothetical protein